MESTYGQIVTTSVASQIADQLQQAIMDGRLKVDQRLPTEEELAARFGVSRPTVREALKRLAARHLVRSRRGPSGGTFVTGPSPEELATSLGTSVALLVATGRVSLDEMATARLEMEAVCCRLAAQNRTEQDLAALQEEIAIQHDVSISDQDFCASDVRFHRAIVNAAGNALLRFLMNAVVEVVTPVSNMIIFRVRDRKEIVAHHERMLAAIAARDADAAVEALGGLVDYIRAQYAKAEEARRVLRR
ncbi:MAG: GntR family transcriptional regulator [Acidobacteriia bacterium]|nr:FadR family transcriptional regulator [Methyloceanibacter sp.]MCL6493023.1 GntR family transcriptional regulator [Terriglobia bacterium]